jgi:uncharacterized protein YndB with AHSA1/START domain
MSAQSQPLATRPDRGSGLRPDTRPSLTLRRWFNASPAKVYAAWTDPKRLAQWWGPGTPEDMRVIELDVRVGGRFHVGFEFQGERHDVHGEYKEVVENEKLVFSWYWKSTAERVSQVTVKTRADGDGCMLTLIHEQLFDEAARLGHTRGWTASLNKMETLFVREDVR